MILAAVGVLSWTDAVDSGVDRLDARLCDEARRFAQQQVLPEDVERFASDVSRKLSLQPGNQVLLWRQAEPTQLAFQSVSWPQGLDLQALTWSDTTKRNPMGEMGDRPGAPPAENGGQSPRPHGQGWPSSPSLGLCQVAGFNALGSNWRVARTTEPGAKAVVAADLTATRAEVRQMLASVAWRAIPVALVLTALGAWLMAVLATRPVARLSTTMETVNQRSLEHRLPVGREDREFKELIDAYNRMLDRLEASFRQATRFSADAAHELRTPLTILQGQIEQAMRLSGDQPIQVQLSQMLDEAGRLASITRKLLLLSQADAGQLALSRTPIDLRFMLQERLADIALLDLPNIRVLSDLAPRLVVQGDTQLMAQALNNLCGNAFKYTVPGGWITVQARALALGVEVVWSNSTLPIAVQERERFFDRFFRGDVAHNRDVDGHGLGLSLARVIVRAHGGDLTLEPSMLEEVRLRLWLPEL